MNILDVIQEKVADSVFGGLYNSVMGCGCCANDLAPCGNIDPIECKFGYYHSTPCEKCDAICHQDYFDFIICGERSNKVDWITPKRIIDAMGEFDLDPCCPPVMPWATADEMKSIDIDCITYAEGCYYFPPCKGRMTRGNGLEITWHGRVWLNPPYGKAQDEWLEKLSAHGNGIALIPVATSTKRWDKLFKKASAICFVRGRINFCDCNGDEIKGNNLDSALIAYGENNVQALKDSGLGNTVVL